MPGADRGVVILVHHHHLQLQGFREVLTTGILSSYLEQVLWWAVESFRSGPRLAPDWSGLKSLLVASPSSSGLSSLPRHLWGCERAPSSPPHVSLSPHLSLGLSVQLRGYMDSPLCIHVEGSCRLTLQLIMYVSSIPVDL